MMANIGSDRLARHSICGGLGQGERYRGEFTPGYAAARRQLRHASTSASEPFDASCKVMLIGDSGVGKTSFLHQFKDAKFPGSTFISTVGVDYRSKILPVDGYMIRFQVWDTAGTERYRSISSSYYRDADSILLFYDITNRQSFNSVRSWLSDVREYGSPDVFVILLGNKTDAEADRKVPLEEGRRLAQDNGIASFIETSAKTGYHVELCHQTIGRKLLGKHNLQQHSSNSQGSSQTPPISLADREQSSAGGSNNDNRGTEDRRSCNYC